MENAVYLIDRLDKNILKLEEILLKETLYDTSNIQQALDLMRIAIKSGDYDNQARKWLFANSNLKDSMEDDPKVTLMEKGFLKGKKDFEYKMYHVKSSTREDSCYVTVNGFVTAKHSMDPIIETYDVGIEEFPDGYTYNNLDDMSPVDFMSNETYYGYIDDILEDSYKRLNLIESDGFVSNGTKLSCDYISRQVGLNTERMIAQYSYMSSTRESDRLIILLSYIFTELIYVIDEDDSGKLTEGLNELITSYELDVKTIKTRRTGLMKNVIKELEKDIARKKEKIKVHREVEAKLLAELRTIEDGERKERLLEELTITLLRIDIHRAAIKAYNKSIKLIKEAN